jgi:hypothetical protein
MSIIIDLPVRWNVANKPVVPDFPNGESFQYVILGVFQAKWACLLLSVSSCHPIDNLGGWDLVLGFFYVESAGYP